MKDHVINSFILQDKNSLVDIYNYIKPRCDKSVEMNDIRIELAKLVKKNIIFVSDKIYKLTKEGTVILNDHRYYYSKIIIRFCRKCNSVHIKYGLREIREEQQKLRSYLINNRQPICIICDKTLPLCLLETAHLKPRCTSSNSEMVDKNIVELMCRYCHNLYDNGFLSVHNGLLHVSLLINNYDLHYNRNKPITYYNLRNKKYFVFHYKYIYKNVSSSPNNRTCRSGARTIHQS